MHITQKATVKKTSESLCHCLVYFVESSNCIPLYHSKNMKTWGILYWLQHQHFCH